ncbi:MAG: peptidylprolyl isomerase [Lachnoclostridium sp.]|nr:peptidylprolyl isomerase [Lachnospira sp.]MCM1247203.1 peptidylprolyl isomerase [Lachnoclostridium sp.]MCM1534576.1 peptidylprolyl isomerase [Clostridium sp.]
MKKSLAKAAVLGLIGAFLLAGCGKSGENQKTASGQAGKQTESAGAQGSQEQEELLTGKHHVNINIKDKGTIAVELDADSAPITVTNFVNLAKSGFYDGLTFHRIIEGFMMQGGDPNGDGTGGSENKIKGEFANNGVENPLSHVRGAISMARSQIKDSASSQFFIVHEDSLFLDGDYAVFGYVTEGMEIVDDICSNATGQDENGILPVGNRPVIESIEVVD